MWFLYLIPKNLLSFLVGKLVHIRLPFGWGPLSARWFASRFQIDLDEAEQSHYSNIGELFTRRLRSGVRPLGENFYVHPADAEVTECGVIKKDILIQVKGKHYTSSGLLKEKNQDREGWSYLTYYLCPSDYHRVHSPVFGEILECTYVPGRLWPVRPWSVNHISQLFSVNERVIVKIQTTRGVVFLVMVGATNVGRMSFSFEPSLITNTSLFAQQRVWTYSPGKPIEKGSELGVFNMGSTVVVVAEKGVLAEPQSFAQKKVKVRS